MRGAKLAPASRDKLRLLWRLDQSCADIAAGAGEVPGKLGDERPQSQSACLWVSFCQQRGNAGNVWRCHAGATDCVIQHGTRPTGADVSARIRNVDLSSIGIKAPIGKERHVDVPI
jgi:hypothetical protein